MVSRRISAWLLSAAVFSALVASSPAAAVAQARPLMQVEVLRGWSIVGTGSVQLLLRYRCDPATALAPDARTWSRVWQGDDASEAQTQLGGPLTCDKKWHREYTRPFSSGAGSQPGPASYWGYVPIWDAEDPCCARWLIWSGTVELRAAGQLHPRAPERTNFEGFRLSPVGVVDDEGVPTVRIRYLCPPQDHAQVSLMMEQDVGGPLMSLASSYVVAICDGRWQSASVRTPLFYNWPVSFRPGAAMVWASTDVGGELLGNLAVKVVRLHAEQSSARLR